VALGVGEIRGLSVGGETDLFEELIERALVVGGTCAAGLPRHHDQKVGTEEVSGKKS